MHRRLAYLLVWLVATGAMMGASWVALTSVVEAATPHRPMSLSVAELRRTTPPAATTTPPRPTAVAPKPPPTSPHWTKVRDANGHLGYQRTFRLVGGDLVVFTNQYETHVVSSRPRAGYTAITTRVDQRTLLVSYVSAQQASRVFVTWRQTPYAEVTETAA